MALHSQSSYSSKRSYVLKLHRDALPHRISGRLENMDSGRHFDFDSAEQLLAQLLLDMSTQPESTSDI